MKFWRICYNYDQRQDCTSCNTSKYTRLESVHKWIINGAPIQTSLNGKLNISYFCQIIKHIKCVYLNFKNLKTFCF